MQKREKEIVELDVKVQKLEKDKEDKVIYVYIRQIYVVMVMLCGIDNIHVYVAIMYGEVKFYTMI